MQIFRKSTERGRSRHGWLDSSHTFSFDDYYDPRYNGFGTLRVINEDVVVGGAGFPTHSHRDMEILSYVVEGALQHRDSLGTGSVIRPGEIQRMSAGKGISHSEFNASPSEPVHFLQIWVLPERAGLTPSYEQSEAEVPEGGSLLLAAPEGQGGRVLLHQNLFLSGARMREGQRLSFPLRTGHGFWVQVISGRVQACERALGDGDGLGITGMAELTLKAASSVHLLVFEV